MRRVIIAGGTGFFGQAAIESLQNRGIHPLAVSRRHGQPTLDVEDRDSLKRTLQPGDIILDTVGPFQDRSTTLIESAIEIGCDVVDISDSLAYAQRVFALRERIAAAGIRVLSSCSTVSVVSALLVADCGIAEPVRVSGFLAPSARHSASAATSDSLLRSIGRPVQVWHDSGWQTLPGWLPSRRLALPSPIGTLYGHLFESADSFWLPQIWPSLRSVDLYVDTRIPGFNRVLALAARSAALRAMVEHCQSAGLWLARRLGRSDGCFAIEVEDAAGRTTWRAVHCPRHGYRLAVTPAVAAVCSLVDDRTLPHGLIPVHQQVEPAELMKHLREAGFEICQRATACS